MNSKKMLINSFDIEVERKRIKNIHLSVYPPDARIHLSLPYYLSDVDAVAFITDKTEWLKKQIEVILSQERQPKREYVSGESYYLFGERLMLKVIALHTNTHKIEIKDGTIFLLCNKNATIEMKEYYIKKWYRQQLQNKLVPIVAKWQNIMKEDNVTWQIKQMKNYWGSCNIRRRNILFNLLLARVPVQYIEYVVVHELCHLKERLHNKIFKSYMDLYMPNWKAQKQGLNSFIALNL